MIEPERIAVMFRQRDGDGDRRAFEERACNCGTSKAMPHVEGRRVVVHNMRGTLNGGPFQFSGQLDRSGEELTLEAKAPGREGGARRWNEAASLRRPGAGRMRLSTSRGSSTRTSIIQGKGKTWESTEPLVWPATGWSRSTRLISDGSADRRRAVENCGAQTARAGCVDQDRLLDQQSARITTDHFVLDVGRVPLALSGWTDFDGRLDYRINLNGLERPASRQGPPLSRAISTSICKT